VSLFEDTYRTIVKPSEGIFRDKGSKFIAYAYPIRSDHDVRSLLDEVRALHPKARHHCWAYRLTPDRSVYRVNDDGEPSGSAGRPILNAILSADLTNILVVVVRYFGGTLLGVPGLINAYKTATKEALDAAEIEERTVNDCYEIEFDYLAMNDVMRVVKEEHLNVLHQNFDNQCTLAFSLRQQQVERVIARLNKLGLTKIRYLRTL
jgi:uncharacterized YigZ family protein